MSLEGVEFGNVLEAGTAILPINVEPSMETTAPRHRTDALERRLAEAQRENQELQSRLQAAAPFHEIEAFYREAMESLPGGFALFDADDRLQLFNDRYRAEIWPMLADILAPGVEFQRLVRTAFERGLWAGIHHGSDQDMREAMARHQGHSSVAELQFPGSRWIRQTKRRTASGGVIACYEDITEVRRREQAFGESEERHRKLMTTLPDAVIIHSGGKIAFVNPAAIKLFCAADHTQLVGRGSLDLIHPESRAVDTGRTRQVLAEQCSLPPVEQKTIRLDGATIDVETRSTFIIWNAKPALLSVIRDLTDRNRTQDSLRQSEERYRRLVELSPDSIHVESGDRIIFVNSAGLRLFGAAAAHEMIGRTILELTPPGDQALVLARQKTLFSGGLTPMTEQRRVRLNGEIFWAAVTAIPLTWQGQTAALVVTRDITSQKHAAERMKEAKDAAEFANRSKTEFLANMSHELRTPLNAVIGFSEIMKEEMFGAIGHGNYLEYVKDIHESGTHLLNVINDLLDLSKVEAGKMEPNFDTVDVVKAIDASLRVVGGRARENRIAVTARIEPGLPAIHADERMIKQILLNLLSNAVKFTPEGGKVRLRARLLSGGETEISVTDTGIGIAQADLETVMAPFGQVENIMTRKFDGTGLGLPLTRSLVEIHGGELRVRSKQGLGTKVIVRLPPGGASAHREAEREGGK
jgi:PAS domain S-box-containing protein